MSAEQDPRTCQVELFGPARLLVGVRELTVEVGEVPTLRSVALALAERCPALVGPVVSLERQYLSDGYIFNLNGRDFVTRPETAVRPGDRLLLLSNAAGG